MEAHESTRKRLESSLPKDHIAGKGYNSMSHCNWVHKFIPMPQAMRIPDAKSSSGQGMEEARDDSSMEFGKRQEQKGGYSGSTMRQKESPLCHTDGYMSPQK